MNWETLLCFGDSITFGARSYLGYPEICADLLGKKLKKHWNVINHSTNGFTTVDLLRSVDKNSAHLKDNFPGLITIMIGTNDVKINTDNINFEIAYSLLVTKAKLLSVSNNIILIKIPSITKDVFYPYNFSMNEKIRTFNNIIELIATREHIKIISFDFEKGDYFDGVHLNEQGVKNAANQLSNFILKEKGIENITTVPQNALSSN